MSVLIKHMAMPKGCIYANDKDQTEYCPLLNHDDVPFCQYIENEPEIAIGIDERPVYCPLSDVPEPCEDAISRQAAIDAICNACGKIDCDKMDKCEKLQLPPANCSEFPNNSDTISRQDAVSRRRLLSDLKELITAWEKYPVMAEQIKGVEVAIGYVELIPSAQSERKTGHWIVNVEKENTISGSCSACGWQAHLYEDDVVGMNFCPNCGADMRGEQDET